MRLRYLYALILLLGTMPLSAQTADPLNFAARFERTPLAPGGLGGDVLLKWQSVPGYRDTLESTTDFLTWAPVLPPLCGYGQTYSVSVPDAKSVPGAGGGQYIPVYSYSQRRFADGTILLTWTSGDLPWRKKFAPASAWATLDWPGSIDFHKTDPDPPRVPYRTLIMTVNAHPLANATTFADTPNLTADAQDRLDRLLTLHDDLQTAIANTPPPAGPEQIGTASSGDHALLRVRREMLDADDDLLNDCQEYTWGFYDENNPDPNGDGTLDTNEDFDADGSTNLQELAFATDMVSGSNPYSPAATYYFNNNVFSNRIDFRCWQDIRKPYRYQVVESTDLLTWSPVNHYTRLLPQFTQTGPVPGMDILSVKASTLPCTLPVPYLRVRTSRAWPPYYLKHPTAPVRRAYWKAHNNAHVDALIPNNEFGRNIFDGYDPTGTARWAKWCWTNQLDFSGVSFNDGGDYTWDTSRYTATNSTGNSTGAYARWESAEEITMITPIHGILAGHWQMRRLPPAAQVVLHDRYGNRILRRVVATQPPIPEPTPVYWQPQDDIAIVRLDSPVPDGVKIYKLFKPIADPASPGTEFIGAKLIATTREMEAFPYEISPGAPIVSSEMGIYSSAGTPLFYRFQPGRTGPFGGLDRVQVGDSSGPAFMFYKGEQILVGHNWRPGSGFPGPGGLAAVISFYPSNAVFANILALVTQLNQTAPVQNYLPNTISLDP